MAHSPIKVERLYIVPTSHGLAVLGLNLIFILVAAASGNNSVYILAFIMFGVYLLAMVATHVNLKSLEVELVEAGDGFVGEAARMTFALRNPSVKSRFMIRAAFKSSKVSAEALQEEILMNAKTLVSVSLVKNARGVYMLPPLQLSSVYPIGLFRAWTTIKVESQFFVYPKREGTRGLDLGGIAKGSGNSRGGQMDTQHEDFREHKRYELGESHHHVDWKAFARSGNLLTKRYETSAPEHFVLDWKSVAHLGTEPGLSQMSQWIEELRKGNMSFEIRLPGVAIGGGHGWAHGQECLRELAKFKGGSP